MNLANPPVNAPLLDYLAKGFIEHEFDMKWLHREILNSRTYQLSWIPNSTNRHDERNFSRAVPRRLPAEIAYDMMTQVTRNDAKNTAFVTELDKRAVAIPGAALKARNGNPADYALTVFGRSIRESNCDCDRTEEPSLLQTIFVRNDGQILAMMDDAEGWLVQVAAENNLKFTRKSQFDQNDAGGKAKQKAGQTRQFKVQIEQKKEQIAEAEKSGNTKRATVLADQLKKIRKEAKRAGALAPEDDDESPAAASESPATEVASVVPSTWNSNDVINEAYLRSVSRFPTADEMQTAQTYIAESTDPIDGVRGVLWALMNTREFIVNH